MYKMHRVNVLKSLKTSSIEPGESRLLLPDPVIERGVIQS